MGEELTGGIFFKTCSAEVRPLEIIKVLQY
jgi:hypothetical protein